MGTLRLLLALSVVLSHSGPLWPFGTELVGGVLAVQGFFLISGFYMALVLRKRYRDGLGDFYWHRFVRLFPLYWLVWMLYFIAGELEPSVDRFAALSAIDASAGTWALVLIANWLLVGSDWLLLLSTGPGGLYFTPDFLAEPIWLFKFHYVPQAWSLPIEIGFYALAPWLVHSVKRLVWVAVASVLAKYLVLAQIGPVDPWYYRFFPFELWLFCLGALVFRLSEPVSQRALSRWRWPVMLCLVLAIVGYQVGSAAPLNAIDSIRYVAFIAALSLAMPVLFSGFGHLRWDRWLGELSYPIYLSHLLVVGVVLHFGLQVRGDTSLLIVAGSLLLGALLTVCVARPVERLLRRSPKHRALLHSPPASPERLPLATSDSGAPR